MAFRIDCVLEGYEFRGVKSGTTDKGTWMSLVVENEDAEQCEVRVPQELQAGVYGLGLRKGDTVTCEVVAYADHQ